MGFSFKGDLSVHQLETTQELPNKFDIHIPNSDYSSDESDKGIQEMRVMMTRKVRTTRLSKLQ
jgi:hypothetical protein